MFGAVALLFFVFLFGFGTGWLTCLKAVNSMIKDVEESERIKRLKQFSRFPNE